MSGSHKEEEGKLALHKLLPLTLHQQEQALRELVHLRNEVSRLEREALETRTGREKERADFTTKFKMLWKDRCEYVEECERLKMQVEGLGLGGRGAAGEAILSQVGEGRRSLVGGGSGRDSLPLFEDTKCRVQ